MASTDLLQWKLFRDPTYTLNVEDFSGIHFFNNGESAFLLRDGKLYSYGTGHKCCMGNKNMRGTGYLNITNPFLIRDLNASGIKAISSGSAHAVLLDNDGHVFCWGSNGHGQLGAGHESEIIRPYKTSLNNIEQISCGESFTIALSKHNELWFWGKLYYTPAEIMFHNSPSLIEITGFPSIKNISAGSQHAAVLTDDGKVYTWGRNSTGQLGHAHRNVVRLPLLVPSPTEFKFVLCADEMTVFVIGDGRLYYCNALTNNAIKCLSDSSSTCKNTVSIATHWRSKLVVAVDENRHCYKSSVVGGERTVLIRTSQDIVGGFIDIGTPSILPNQNIPGVMAIRHRQPQEPLDGCGGHVDITNLYNCENFSDIQIKLSDGILYAHKLILAAKSTKFNQLILENNPQLKVLDMSNMNASAYKTYIKFLYTGVMDLKTIEDIPEIYYLAKQDKNEISKKICLNHWKNSLKKENIILAFLIAYTQNLQVLMKACGPILHQNLQDILASESYGGLSNEVKLALLTTASLRCGSHCKE